MSTTQHDKVAAFRRLQAFEKAGAEHRPALQDPGHPPFILCLNDCGAFAAGGMRPK